MSQVQNNRVLRTLLLLGVCIACATAMFWSTASADGLIEYVRTTAASQQPNQCNAGDTCLEWCTRSPTTGQLQGQGIFCCGNESVCRLAPGGPF